MSEAADDNELIRQLLEQVRRAVKHVESAVVGRGAECRLMLLSLLSQEHILLLGPPGVGKSYLSRKIVDVVHFPPSQTVVPDPAAGSNAPDAETGANEEPERQPQEENPEKKAVRENRDYFEILLTPFSVPAELFGPLNIKQLQESGTYKRLTDLYLPNTHLAFVDEVFKANSAILNSLLMILNERKFSNHDESETPLKMVIGASNEFCQDDNLEALYDRFMFRMWVEYLQEGDFDELIRRFAGTKSPDDRKELTKEEKIDWELVTKVNKMKDWLQLSAHVIAVVLELRKLMAPHVSDRRWVAVIKILKIIALTKRGGKNSQVADLAVLQYCLWLEEDADLDTLSKQPRSYLHRVQQQIVEAILRVCQSNRHPDLGRAIFAELQPTEAGGSRWPCLSNSPWLTAADQEEWRELDRGHFLSVEAKCPNPDCGAAQYSGNNNCTGCSTPLPQ